MPIPANLSDEQLLERLRELRQERLKQKPISAQIPLTESPLQPSAPKTEFPVTERLYPEYQLGQPSPTPLISPETAAALRDPITGELRKTPETEKTPEFITTLLKGKTTGTLGQDLNVAAGILFSLDDKDRLDVVLKNIPGTKKREDEKGNIFVDFPDGTSSMVNKPGFSFTDAIMFLRDIPLYYAAGRAAPAVRGLARAPGALKGVRGQALVGGTAAAGTEVARAKLAQQFGAEQPVSILETGLAGATGAVSEVALPLAKKGQQFLAQRRLKADQLSMPSDISPMLAEKKIKEAREITKDTGVEFFPAQILEEPEMLKKQAWLAKQPGAVKKAREELQTQNAQVADYVDLLMNKIAPLKVLPDKPTVFEGLQTTIGDVIKAKKEIRKLKTKPLYDKASLDPQLLDLPKTQKVINALKKESAKGTPVRKLVERMEKQLFGVEVSKTKQQQQQIKQELLKTAEEKLPLTLEQKELLVKVKNIEETAALEAGKFPLTEEERKRLLEIADKKMPLISKEDILTLEGKKNKQLLAIEKGEALDERNIAKLHSVNVYMGELIDQVGEKRLSATKKRALSKIKESLLSEMKEASPDYKKASDVFKKISPPVDEVKEAIISRIAGFEKTQFGEIIGTLAKGMNIDPIASKKVRRIIEKRNPTVWRMIVRRMFEDRLDSLTISRKTPGAENLSKEMYNALFKTAKDKRSISDFLPDDPEIRKNVTYLRKTLEKTMKAKPEILPGSPDELQRSIQKGKRALTREVLTPITKIGQYGGIAATILTQETKRGQARRLASEAAEAVFNPRWKADMAEIRKLDPLSPIAVGKFTALLEKIRASKTGKLIKPTLQAVRGD